MGVIPQMRGKMTADEIVIDLLSKEQAVLMLDRTLRTQGYSKVLAVTKLIPRDFEFIRVFKVRKHKNAVLLLIVNPAKRGYNAQTGNDECRD